MSRRFKLVPDCFDRNWLVITDVNLTEISLYAGRKIRSLTVRPWQTSSALRERRIVPNPQNICPWLWTCTWHSSMMQVNSFYCLFKMGLHQIYILDQIPDNVTFLWDFNFSLVFMKKKMLFSDILWWRRNQHKSSFLCKTTCSKYNPDR